MMHTREKKKRGKDGGWIDGIKQIRPGVYKALALGSKSQGQKQPRREMTFVTPQGASIHDTLRQARAWRLETQNELRAARVHWSERTITTLYNEFMAYSKKRCQPSSCEAYVHMLGHFLRFCDAKKVVLVNDITYDFCQEYYDSLNRSFKGSGSNVKWSVLLAMINYELNPQCVDAPALTTNPALKVVVEKLNPLSDEVRPFTPSEVAALRERYNGERNRYMFDILLNTGLRIGELGNLSVDQLSISEDGRIMIDIRPHHGWVPKHYRSTGRSRQVPAVGGALTAIRFFLGENANRTYLIGGDEPVPNCAFSNAFRTAREGIIRELPSLAKRFLERRPDDNNTHWLTPHTYRKTFACTMLGRGFSFAEVGALLGHSEEQMTKKYARFQPDAMSRISDRMHAAMEQESQDSTATGETKGETILSKLALASR
jgi:integrase